MSEKFTYLLVDFFCIVFPLLFSFHPKLQFYKKWKSFLLPCVFTATFFLIWDVLFTHWGVWSFSPKYVVGVYLVNLPIEEILFFICIPYACVFSYYCFTLFFNFSKLRVPVNVFYYGLAIALLCIAFFNLEKLYTSVTFILLSVFLLFLLIKKSDFLPTFFFCFLFILIPFVVSNGVLTGSFFGRTVVSYNDSHNLGIRLLTIPIEDTFYGMLLLLMNVYGFEYLRRKSEV